MKSAIIIGLSPNSVLRKNVSGFYFCLKSFKAMRLVNFSLNFKFVKRKEKTILNFYVLENISNSKYFVYFLAQTVWQIPSAVSDQNIEKYK